MSILLATGFVDELTEEKNIDVETNQLESPTKSTVCVMTICVLKMKKKSSCLHQRIVKKLMIFR